MTTTAEKPRHIHYCKDFRDTKVCAARGYCECECGAQAKVVWVEPLDLMAALKSSLADGTGTP